MMIMVEMILKYGWCLYGILVLLAGDIDVIIGAIYTINHFLST